MAALLQLQWDAVGPPDFAILEIQVCRPTSQGVLTPPRGEWRNLATIDQNEEVIDLTSAWNAKFGRLVLGQKVWLRARLISSFGLASQWLERNQTIL